MVRDGLTTISILGRESVRGTQWLDSHEKLAAVLREGNFRNRCYIYSPPVSEILDMVMPKPQSFPDDVAEGFRRIVASNTKLRVEINSAFKYPADPTEYEGSLAGAVPFVTTPVCKVWRPSSPDAHDLAIEGAVAMVLAHGGCVMGMAARTGRVFALDMVVCERSLMSGLQEVGVIDLTRGTGAASEVVERMSPDLRTLSAAYTQSAPNYLRMYQVCIVFSSSYPVFHAFCLFGLLSPSHIFRQTCGPQLFLFRAVLYQFTSCTWLCHGTCADRSLLRQSCILDFAALFNRHPRNHTSAVRARVHGAPGHQGGGARQGEWRSGDH